MDSPEFLSKYVSGAKKEGDRHDYVVRGPADFTRDAITSKDGIRKWVKTYANDELIKNLSKEDDELGGVLANLREEEFIPIRNKAFTDHFGEGFVEQYEQHPVVGQGSFGTVFENPSDPSRVFKVQQTSSTENDSRSLMQEVEDQLAAADQGMAPRVHSVETVPRKQGSLVSGVHIAEMDKVSDFLNTAEEDYGVTRPEKALEFAKARLKLANTTGIVHSDLGGRLGHNREDHMYYDPKTESVGFIDYGMVEKYDHAQDLHDHEQKSMMMPNSFRAGDRVEHFLDHKVDAIHDGMQAVGNHEEANIFLGAYQELRDAKKYSAASDLVKQGEGLISRHTKADTKLTKVGERSGHRYENVNPYVDDILHDFPSMYGRYQFYGKDKGKFL